MDQGQRTADIFWRNSIIRIATSTPVNEKAIGFTVGPRLKKDYLPTNPRHFVPYIFDFFSVHPKDKQNGRYDSDRHC